MAGEGEGTVDEAERSFFLFRPPETHLTLPQNSRWEFTRRHPYYLTCWELAADLFDHPSDDPRKRRFQEAASSILMGIGVGPSMRPADPKLGPEALGETDLGGAWVGGAVAPATFRTQALMLLLGLPRTQRAQYGRLLTESAEFESSDEEQIRGLAIRLGKIRDEAWDSFPVAPILSINLQMPQRAISEAVESLVGQWKRERGIPERRRRDDKLEDYLQVWDLREGWAEGAYHGDREKTFPEISRETGEKIPTVIDRYRTAFRHLSGHDYTPALWVRLMGPLKLSRFAPAAARLSRRRPWRSPQPRPIAQSVLLPGRRDFDSPVFLEAARVTSPEIDLIDLSLDIDNLLTQGLSDDQILERLEIAAPEARELVAEIRLRKGDR